MIQELLVDCMHTSNYIMVQILTRSSTVSDDPFVNSRREVYVNSDDQWGEQFVNHNVKHKVMGYTITGIGPKLADGCPKDGVGKRNSKESVNGAYDNLDILIDLVRQV